MAVVVSAVAIGSGTIVRTNAEVAAGQAPPSETVMVRVIMPPVSASCVPKVYVGVVLVPLVNVPSPLVLQVIPVPGDPFVAVYPVGIV